MPLAIGTGIHAGHFLYVNPLEYSFGENGDLVIDVNQSPEPSDATLLVILGRPGKISKPNRPGMGTIAIHEIPQVEPVIPAKIPPPVLVQTRYGTILTNDFSRKPELELIRKVANQIWE